MSLVDTKKRTRLNPDVRRNQILDDAANLVLTEGLSSVSMERIGREASVSKGLIYNYFPSREALLAALLHREEVELRDRGMESAMRASTYAELIRQTTRLYLEQTRDRGALISALMADDTVASLAEDALGGGRDATVRYFVRATRREFGLSLPIGIAAVEMLMAVTNQAGKLVARGAIDIDIAEEMCVQFITGGLARLVGTAADEAG